MNRLFLAVSRLGALVLLAIAAAAPLAAAPERRIALVVTNQEHATELLPLAFPHADGRIVSAALKEIGFEVRWLKDASVRDLKQAIDSFASDVQEAGPDAVAMFYFSGHSWPQWKSRTNWLVMNETVPQARELLEGGSGWDMMRKTAKNRDEFLAEIERALPRIGVQIATVTKLLGALETKASFVVIDSHLDVAEPSLMDEKTIGKPKGGGMLLLTQGRPGLSAADSNDFSTALAGALLTPGLEIQDAMRQVQVQVAEKTNGKQVPWFESRMVGKFWMLPAKGGTPEPIPIVAPSLPEDRDQVERLLWRAIRNSSDPGQYENYLKKFPDGDFVELARQRLARLKTSAPAAGAGKRVALVVGNANYKNSGALPNTAHDAADMAVALRDVGFTDVKEKHDLDRAGFVAALREFSEAAADADWAVVYYAGHGMEIGGRNFLIPTDAKLEKEADADDEAVPVARLFDRLSDSKGVKIVILDACRDNPLATRGFRKKRSGSGGGLAKMEADTGTLIALAADPGQPSYDDDGDPSKRNSPYAAAILKHIREPQLDIRLMFGRVYDSMIETMQGKQQPWIQAKLGGHEQYFRP